MSSNSHQIYTRVWARDSKLAIFSIDYRLAPEYPYPWALEDWWQVYFWILNYSQEHLNINPDQIILAGDSAGGNLATAITAMAIKRCIKGPDLLILPYPALSVAKTIVVPSLFYSLTDLILNLNFLNLWFECYLQDGCNQNEDYFLSPLCIPDDILERFPPIRIMVGSIDPLRDLSYLFLQRWVKVNLDVKLTEFAHLPHGFLNYGAPVVGMNEVSEWIDKVRFEFKI